MCNLCAVKIPSNKCLCGILTVYVGMPFFVAKKETGGEDMTFYEKLICLINKKGITQRHFINDLGLNHSAIQNWRRQNSKPRPETMIKIADFLGVDREMLENDEMDLELQPQIKNGKKVMCMTTTIYRLISIITELADRIDENSDFWTFTVNKELDLGFGSRALSGYLRKGAIEIITLQGNYQSAKEKAYYSKVEAESYQKVLEDIFGDADDDEIILDEWKPKFNALYKELYDKEFGNKEQSD